MLAKLVEADLKPEQLREKKDQSYTIKTRKRVTPSFAFIVHYSKEVLTNENEYISCEGEDFRDAFA